MSKCTEIEYRVSYTDWEKVGRPDATLPGSQTKLPAVLIDSTRWETDCAPRVAVSLDTPEGSTVWLYFDEGQLAEMVKCMADAKKESAERRAPSHRRRRLAARSAEPAAPAAGSTDRASSPTRREGNP